MVDDYEWNICFLVDFDRVHIQAFRLRIAWVKPLAYEVIIDDTRDIIESLINEPMDTKDKYFGTYEESKRRISLEIMTPQILKRGKKRLENIRKKIAKSDSPLKLTEGKGDDIEEEDEEEDESEDEVEEEIE